MFSSLFRCLDRTPRARSPSLLGLVLALMLCMFVAACAPKQAINAAAIDQPLRLVCARHDQYVSADTSLGDVERRTQLRSSAMLIDILNTAMSGNAATPAPSTIKVETTAMPAALPSKEATCVGEGAAGLCVSLKNKKSLPAPAPQPKGSSPPSNDGGG